MNAQPLTTRMAATLATATLVVSGFWMAVVWIGFGVCFVHTVNARIMFPRTASAPAHRVIGISVQPHGIGVYVGTFEHRSDEEGNRTFRVFVREATLRPIICMTYHHGGFFDSGLPFAFWPNNFTSAGYRNSMTTVYLAWIPTMIGSAALPAAFGLRWMMRRNHGAKQAVHACAVCGYDLRASPDRCPECGRVIATV